MLLGRGCFKKTILTERKKSQVEKESTATSFLSVFHVKRSEMSSWWGTAGKPQVVSLAGHVRTESGERYMCQARSCDLHHTRASSATPVC